MKRTLSWTLMLILALGCLLLLGGCDDDDATGPATQLEPTVFGILSSDGGMRKAFDNPGTAMITVSNAPAVPSVSVNGDALGLEPELVFYSGAFGFNGQFEIPETGAAAVAVDLNAGDLAATAAVAIPDGGSWILPASSDVAMSYGQSLSASWTAVDNADSYWVSWYFEVGYYDSDNFYEYYYNEGTTFVTGTEFTVAAGDIWPPETMVTSIQNLYGDFDVIPVNGPMTPGDLPNVTGDATGFVVAAGMDLDLDLYLDSGPVKSDDRERDLDIAKTLLEKLQR